MTVSSQSSQTVLLASLVVAATGAFWGVYWLPVRTLSESGLTGAWGTAAITFAAVVFLLPVAVRRWWMLRAARPVTLLSIGLGGAAFALYSVGFVYGRVAIIILLYFLTPVWSTLIARYVMGWHTPRLRILAIVLGLAGLGAMLGAGGEAPLPQGAGEWMALIAGFLWSVSTTGIRATSGLAPPETAFVFATGAAITALCLAPFLDPLPNASGSDALRLAALAFATGGAWWVVSILGLMWAAVRLDPARVGILLMTEVLVGAGSAAILAGEMLSAPEMAGGALVVIAGVLEVWPIRSRKPAS